MSFLGSGSGEAGGLLKLDDRTLVYFVHKMMIKSHKQLLFQDLDKLPLHVGITEAILFW